MTIQIIDNNIYIIREKRVMLDEDLAKIYGVETRILNQAISRNSDRFPNDFMFQLSVEEFDNLMSQIVISRWGGRRKRPFVFTEHGAVMLASVLRSKRAIQMSIEVVKAFVRLRHVLSSQKNLEKQLSEIRSFILKKSNQTDREFKKLWSAIENLAKQPEPQSTKLIGFRTDNE
ncbi:MAG: ORF6N domain-containing protein [Candidatus Gracilibacteria bacterium]|nr:ORF6N domain-containing protein [Candidatus Gracilibacteria bacterium]